MESNRMTEEWRTIKGFDNYEVSNKGNVRNIKTNRLLKIAYQPSGYAIVSLRSNGKTRTSAVNRLVMNAFNPIEDNQNTRYDVVHIDNDKRNNDLTNLKWMTHTDNILRCATPNEIEKLNSMIYASVKSTIINWYNDIKNKSNQS